MQSNLIFIFIYSIFLFIYRTLIITMSLNKIKFYTSKYCQGSRYDSVLENHDLPSRGLRFDSQYPHSGSQHSIISGFNTLTYGQNTNKTKMKTFKKNCVCLWVPGCECITSCHSAYIGLKGQNAKWFCHIFLSLIMHYITTQSETIR